MILLLKPEMTQFGDSSKIGIECTEHSFALWHRMRSLGKTVHVGAEQGSHAAEGERLTI
jgi:hypothetical protein